MKRLTKTFTVSMACLLLTGAVVGGTVGIVKRNKSKTDIPPVPEHVHIEVIDKAVNPTCTDTGLSDGKHCLTCEKVLVEQTIIAALGHNEVIDSGQAATCTQTGLSDGKHCTVCGVVTAEPQEIPLIAHKYVNGVCVMCDKDDPSATLDVNAFYLVGSMNDWVWTSDRYKFNPVATDIANITSQYKLTVTLDKDAQVRIWKGVDYSTRCRVMLF